MHVQLVKFNIKAIASSPKKKSEMMDAPFSQSLHSREEFPVLLTNQLCPQNMTYYVTAQHREGRKLDTVVSRFEDISC